MEKLISIKNLTYDIPHTGTILEDINLEIGPAEFVGVLGHNGAGKTTLIDLIMGFRNTTQGSISVLGENPNSDDRRNKHHIAFLSHDVALKGSISVDAFLQFYAGLYPNYSLELQEELLKIFELKKDSSIGSLSLGQAKKVQFVAGFASRPKLIIADEVTAVFDPRTRELFFEQLQSARVEASISVILATNIADDLVGVVDKVFFIKNKKGSFHQTSDLSNLYELKKAA